MPVSVCLTGCILLCLQVLFDDIGQSLIRLSSPGLQLQLIEAFLQFLGVPSGFLPPASCLYLAMDESSVFDSELSDEKPLTYFNPSFSGISYVGYMEQLGCPRWTKGHNREGEEFVRNVFHLVLPLFSGKQKSQLCLSWLRYEIAKVTAAASSLTACQCLTGDRRSPKCTRAPSSHNLLLHESCHPLRCGGTAGRQETGLCLVSVIIQAFSTKNQYLPEQG